MDISKKKVLITGAGGFIPSHVTRRIVNLGADVYVTTKYNSLIDNVRICDLWDKVTVIEADLRNQDSLKQIAQIRPDVIIHMAAYNHVGDSFTHVAESIESNTLGTANLIEAYDGYEKFVYTSTSEIYGFQDSVPFEETMTPFPISPYSIGKFGGELYARMKHHSKNFPIAVLRPFNTFGPYQSPRAIIGEMILKCLRGETILSTEGKQTREFNFVENIVDGFMLTVEKEDSIGKVINIGSGQEIAICDLIKKIHELTESKSELKIGALENRPTEIWRMCAANSNAKEILGWEPKISFEEGLVRTIDWFRRFVKTYCDKNSQLMDLCRSN